MFDVIKREFELAKLKLKVNLLEKENKEFLVKQMDCAVFKSQIAKELREEIEMEYKQKEYDQYVENCNRIAVALASNVTCPEDVLRDIYNVICKPHIKNFSDSGKTTSQKD